MSTTPEPTRLENLVLARLAVNTKRGLKPSDVRVSLAPYVEHALSAAEWHAACDETLAALAAAGFISRRPLSLTEAGRERLRGFLRVDRDLDWKAIKTHYLAAELLGLRGDAAPVRKRMRDADGLRACILQSRHALPTGSETPTLEQAIEAWVWRQLGIETDARLTVNAIKAHFLRQALDADPRTSASKLKQRFVARAAGAHRTDAGSLRIALARNWLGQPQSPRDHVAAGALETPASEPETQMDAAAGHSDAAGEPGTTGDRGPEDEARDSGDGAGEVDRQHFALHELARQVNEVARELARQGAEGSFGGDRVFVSAVWRAMRDRPICAAISPEKFKAHLVHANRRDLVSLHRADLTPAMPADEVRASEIRYLTARFHFVGTRSES